MRSPVSSLCRIDVVGVVVGDVGMNIISVNWLMLGEKRCPLVYATVFRVLPTRVVLVTKTVSTVPRLCSWRPVESHEDARRREPSENAHDRSRCPAAEIPYLVLRFRKSAKRRCGRPMREKTHSNGFSPNKSFEISPEPRRSDRTVVRNPWTIQQSLHFGRHKEASKHPVASIGHLPMETADHADNAV